MAVTPEDEAQHPLPDSQLAAHAETTLKQLRLEQWSNTKAVAKFFLAVGFHKPHVRSAPCLTALTEHRVTIGVAVQLPFVFPAHKLDLYPLEKIRLPANQLPPRNMPGIAWSSYGELLAYHDVAALHASGAPGTVLPSMLVKELRRAYYAAVSHTDDQLGRVLGALRQNGFQDDTVTVMWGDHGWQLSEHGEWCKHTK